MRTSVSLNDELTSYVEETASSAGENNAEAIREVVRHARTLEDEIDDLQATIEEREADLEACRDRVAQLETDVERLQNEKRQILEQREEHTELVREVERQRTIEEKRAEAGVATRAKWWLFGMDDE